MGLTNTEYPFWLCLLVTELIINQSFVWVYKVWIHYSYILESNSFYLYYHAPFQLNPRKVPELSAVSCSVLFCTYWCREITHLYDSFVNRVRRLAASFFSQSEKAFFLWIILHICVYWHQVVWLVFEGQGFGERLCGWRNRSAIIG